MISKTYLSLFPSDLATYGRDAKALLKELQSQNERMFLVTFLVLNTGRTEQELENNVFQASSIAQKHNCNLCRLDYQQEQGLMSSLPLADNQIEIQRGLTTSSTAIFIPFTTQELYQAGKESLYYGLNALSNNLIMVDRKRLKNPNGLILGTPGSGKSFSAKREIANAFLVTDDDIIVNDPEGEYSPLVNRLKGQVIKISPTRAAIIEKLVAKGFLERKGDKKTKVLLPTDKGKALITVMPEEIQSADMTADWETKLLRVERGEMEPETFMTEINDMISSLVNTTEAMKGASALMKNKVIGVCPNCGANVVEREKGWFCEANPCRFVLWKDNAFFKRLGKRLDAHVADKLLRDGRVRLKDCKSAKGKVYNATVLLATEAAGRSKFSLEFEGGR